MILKIGSRYLGLRYLVLAEDVDPTAPPPRPMRVVMSDGIAVYLDGPDADCLRRRLDGLSGEPPVPAGTEGGGRLASTIVPIDPAQPQSDPAPTFQVGD